ncbi:hypothetical protein DF141_06500 [Burkholderia cenocepacia]|nr:hypothetical protein DF141_06500 [Burkholderia cenocepacia]
MPTMNRLIAIILVILILLEQGCSSTPHPPPMPDGRHQIPVNPVPAASGAMATSGVARHPAGGVA